MLPENAIQFPLDDENPLSFIDHSVLALIQVQDVYDLNEILSALLTENVVLFIHQHKDMFSVLSGTINSKIRETVFDVTDITFPDGLLMIPPLFEQLSWDTQPDDWNAEKQRYTSEFNKAPCLTYALALLFINSMKSDMTTAMESFIQAIDSLPEDESVHAERYLENLQYFGWPAEGAGLRIVQQ